MISSPIQRRLLLGFIAALSLAGLVGIYALVFGRAGWFEVRILLSTLSFGAASILGMAAAVAWETRRWHPLGPITAALVGVALALMLLLIWIDRSYPHDWFPRTAASTAIVAAALAHASLVSLARLHLRFEWVRTAALLAIGVLATTLIALIFDAEDWIGDEFIWRFTGVVAIVNVCATLTVPVLHRLSQVQARAAHVSSALEVALTCPRCQKAQTRPVGRSRCECGLSFNIEIEEERCPRCGYALYKLTSATCPECGEPIAARAP